MRAVRQRVSRAQVSVDGTVLGKIDRGFLILLGVSGEDSREIAERMADKICRLRIFEDADGKTNCSLADVGGALLVISQFTLYADCRRGRRPSFTEAAKPDEADRLYRYYVEQLCREGIRRVETGVFGADMKVSLLNDGPVTILLDTKELTDRES